MVRPVEKILQDVLDLMGKFEYTENEDRPSNSFFEAELNEDGFFILRQEIRDYLVSAKNTEQQVQLDSEQKQGTFDNSVDAAVSVAPRELT